MTMSAWRYRIRSFAPGTVQGSARTSSWGLRRSGWGRGLPPAASVPSIIWWTSPITWWRSMGSLCMPLIWTPSPGIGLWCAGRRRETGSRPWTASCASWTVRCWWSATGKKRWPWPGSWGEKIPRSRKMCIRFCWSPPFSTDPMYESPPRESAWGRILRASSRRGWNPTMRRTP